MGEQIVAQKVRGSGLSVQPGRRIVNILLFCATSAIQGNRYEGVEQ